MIPENGSVVLTRCHRADVSETSHFDTYEWECSTCKSYGVIEQMSNKPHSMILTNGSVVLARAKMS